MQKKTKNDSVKTIKARATETLLSSCTVSGFLYFYRCFQKITEIVGKNALNTGIREDDCGLRSLKQLYVRSPFTFSTALILNTIDSARF